LMIDDTIILDSVDIVDNMRSHSFLCSKYMHCFFHIDSSKITGEEWLSSEYDLIFIDGDHSEEAVIRDIKTSLKFNPKYLLFDDVRHPSHSYIERIITQDFKEQLEVVKLWEFNDIWEGYSMALCKIKNNE